MRNLKLLPQTIDDIDILLSWVKSEKELRQWAGPTVFKWPLNRERLSTYLARMTGVHPEVYIYKAVEDNVMVGHVEFDKIDYINKTTVLSRVIVNPNLRGQGLGHEIIRLSLAMAFNVLKLEKVTLSVYDFNKSAIACYKAAGLNIVSIIQDPHKNLIENWDTQIMSISSSEFQASAESCSMPNKIEFLAR